MKCSFPSLRKQQKMSKPTALILGGVGFIGRNLATYLVENDLCAKVFNNNNQLIISMAHK